MRSTIYTNLFYFYSFFFFFWLKYFGNWNLSNRFRCLDKSQFFPPGRSIWCNSNRKGPTARPTSTIGGHACCGNSNLCNLQLKPIVLDYRQSPATVFNQGDRRQNANFTFFFFILSCESFLSQSNLTKWILFSNEDPNNSCMFFSLIPNSVFYITNDFFTFCRVIFVWIFFFRFLTSDHQFTKTSETKSRASFVIVKVNCE